MWPGFQPSPGIVSITQPCSRFALAESGLWPSRRTDRVNWQPAEGDLGPTSWTGTIDGDPVEIYYRVLTEKLFPD